MNIEMLFLENNALVVNHECFVNSLLDTADEPTAEDKEAIEKCIENFYTYLGAKASDWDIKFEVEYNTGNNWGSSYSAVYSDNPELVHEFMSIHGNFWDWY